MFLKVQSKVIFKPKVWTCQKKLKNLHSFKIKIKWVPLWIRKRASLFQITPFKVAWIQTSFPCKFIQWWLNNYDWLCTLVLQCFRSVFGRAKGWGTITKWNYSSVAVPNLKISKWNIFTPTSCGVCTPSWRQWSIQKQFWGLRKQSFGCRTIFLRHQRCTW